MVSTTPQSFSRPKYRPDVDGMRALAILSVLFFHAFPESLPGGFVGVDIFFVISGYLISSIIFRGLTLGTFSFFDFYARRVRRIFPAVTAVLLGSYILGFYLLSPEELLDLIRESPYAAFFLENWRLYVTTGGYWETATELKPFMHFWSLGVEEQYYIFYPLICFLLWKASAKRFLLSLFVMLAVSLVLCLYDTYNDPVRAFYSLHSRFWELLIGGVLAYVELKWPDYKEKIISYWSLEAKNNALSAIGLGLILGAVFFFEEGKYFPGWRALLPTMGSVLIIAAGAGACINKYVFSNKLAVFIGLISYPLYLWHWPFICIFRNNLAGDLPQGFLMLGLIAASFVMAYLTYTFIERPMRSKAANWKLVLILVALLALTSEGTKEFVRKSDFAKQAMNIERAADYVPLARDVPKTFRRDNLCLGKFGEGFENCHTFGQNPSVVLFGDSHAHMLLGYLQGKQNLPDFYLIANDGMIIFDNAHAIRRDRDLNNMALVNHFWSVVENSPDVKTIILRGYWGHYLKDSIKSEVNDSWSPQELFIQHWTRLLERMVSKGKKIVVVLDNPELKSSVVKKCISTRRIQLAEPCQSEIPADQVDIYHWQAKQLLLETLKPFMGKGVTVIDISDTLCSKGKCSVMMDNKLLYIDNNHLSLYGSEVVWPLIEKAILTGSTN